MFKIIDGVVDYQNCFVREGDKVSVRVKENNPGRAYCENLTTGRKFITSPEKLPKHFEGFIDKPSLSELEQQLNDGVSVSLLGEDVEVDGYDSWGFPSWVMALALA